MVITEWNTERANKIAREEAREEGLEQGLEQGIEIGEARGEAKAKTEILQIIKMHMQKKAPKEISVTLDIPLAKVKATLREAGLMEQEQ